VKAIFGVISLLIVVALAGFVAGKQLKSLRQGAVIAPAAAGSANPNVAAQQLQQKVRDDVAKALEQGAQNNARSEDAAK